MKSQVLGLLALVLGYAIHVAAFFKIHCKGPMLLERADPVVTPGQVSPHLHTIMGGNGFNFTMTYADARQSTCTSCKVKEDLSNYWIPDLFYQAQNGSFHPVGQDGLLVYYLLRNEPDEEIYPFPEGFRMVAGNPFLRSPTSPQGSVAISFVCLGAGNNSMTGYIPNINCPAGLRAQVFFPGCWDGVNLDSPNHMDHVAYPSHINGGRCPKSHPKHLVSIFYEVIFQIDAWKDLWWNPDGSHPFVFSMGDPTGYGLHGDFVNGWDVDVLNTAIHTCTDESGAIEACHAVTLFEDDINDDCVKAPRVDEQISGWMQALPGCNPVQYGPGDAVPVTGCGATNIIGEEKTYYTNVTGWDYVGCAWDQLDSRTLPERYVTVDMTVETCTTYCGANGYTYAGLEWAQECWCGNSVAPDRLGAHKCRMTCAGNDTEYCGDARKLSLYQATTAAKPRKAKVSV